MIDTDTLNQIERLASQAMEMETILRYLELPSDAASDTGVQHAYEYGRAAGAEKVTAQLVQASSRGNVSAAKTLMSRMDAEPTSAAEEKPPQLWPDPPSKQAYDYCEWVKQSIEALKTGTVSAEAVRERRPVLTAADWEWVKQYDHEADIELLFSAQPALSCGNTELTEWASDELGVSGVSKVGRPPSQIDPADLGSLANAGLTQAQAATRLGISIRTLRTKLTKEKVLRAAWNAGTERHRKRVAREKAGAKVPGRRPGRPPKIQVDMDPKAELYLTARLTEMLVRKAEGGSVAAMRALLDRLMPLPKG